MNGWLPNSIVSERGKTASQKSLGPTSHPLLNPGAACDFDILETTIVRCNASRTLSGE